MELTVCINDANLTPEQLASRFVSALYHKPLPEAVQHIVNEIKKEKEART